MQGYQKRRLYLFTALLGLGFLMSLGAVLTGLFSRWMNDPTYSYGMLVPVISTVLIWNSRNKLFTQPIKPVRWALIAVVASLLLAAFGMSGSIPSLARLAIPLFLLASVLYLLGWAIFKQLLFPLGFLIFMLPLPAQIQVLVTPWLQTQATQLGASLLQLAGYPASTQGNLILVGETPMNVAEACSGLRYIFPLVGVGLLYSCLFEKHWWKRVANVLIAIPIAILMNAVRIAGTGIAIVQFGEQAGGGIYHDLEAYFVLLSAFFLHFIFSQFLHFFPPYSAPKPELLSASVAPRLSMESANRLITHMGVVILLLVVLSALTRSVTAMPAYKLNHALDTFPLNISGWVGKQYRVPDRIIKASGAEQSFSAVYKNINNDKIDFYLGFQGEPFRENNRFFHSPEICLPGSGWRTQALTQRISGGLKITEQISRRNGKKILTQFWFQTNKGTDASAFSHQVRLATQALQRQNSYDLFIRVITEIQDNDSIDQRREILQHFVHHLTRELPAFFDKKT